MSSNVDYTDGGTTSNLGDILKNAYRGTVNDQLNNSNLIVEKLDSKKANEKFTGDKIVISIRVKNAVSAQNVAEGGDLPRPVAGGYEQTFVNVVQTYASASLTGLMKRLAETNEGAFMRSITASVEDMRLAAEKELGRQLYGSHDGAYPGKVASVSGSVITMTDAWPFYANWFEEGIELQVGTVTSGTFSVTSTRPVVRITAVDVDNLTITVEEVTAGLTAIAANDRFVKSGTANINAVGLDEIYSNGVLQGIDPATHPVWKANVDTVSGSARTLTLSLFRKHINLINRKSGLRTSKDRIVLTTQGLERTLHDECETRERFVNTNGNLKTSLGTELTIDDYVIKGDFQAPSGKLRVLDTSKTCIYDVTDKWEFLGGSDGSKGTYFDYKDVETFVLARYWQLATEQRNAHGSLEKLTDTSVD